MTKLQISIITSLTLVISTVSCRQSQIDVDILEGDLFFRPFRYGSFYNQPDSVIKAFVTYADTATLDSLSTADKDFVNTYYLLKKENRLFSPFVELRSKDSSIVKLYLDSLDYDKVKVFKRKELQAKGKKVIIKAQATEIGIGILICKKLISVEKTDGLTMQGEKKFKIEDYE